MKIEARFKLEFFDRPAVIAALDDATRRSLSKAGAYIMTSARRSMRPAPKRSRARVRAKLKSGRPFRTLSDADKRAFYGSSDPGKPPNKHDGALRRLLVFGYDRDMHSVVIGPTPFRDGVAPNVLEFGGQTVIRKRKRNRKGTYKKRVIVEPRPYMDPALQANLNVIPEQFRNSVRGK